MLVPGAWTANPHSSSWIKRHGCCNSLFELPVRLDSVARQAFGITATVWRGEGGVHARAKLYAKQHNGWEERGAEAFHYDRYGFEIKNNGQVRSRIRIPDPDPGSQIPNPDPDSGYLRELNDTYKSDAKMQVNIAPT